MTKTSPSGKQIVPSHGPLNAKLVFVGESPAAEEVKEGQPLVGKSGKMLNMALRHAGISRDDVYLMNLVPVRAPGDHFAHHDSHDLHWGRATFKSEISRLRSAHVFVALGANPTEWLLGSKPPVVQRGERVKEGFISEWRGSVIPSSIEDGMPQRPEDYLQQLPDGEPPRLATGSVILPTFHPAAVLRQFTWHPWFLQDIAKAAKIVREGLEPIKYRQWYYNSPDKLRELAASGIDLISVDSELDPKIISIVTAEEVHVFEWSEQYRAPLTQLLSSDRVLKIAHNWGHDHAWFRKVLDITVARPIYDTQGAAHILNMALQKELSPHISTRYTNWPYHKWLANIDPLTYCGMDSIVCYDAYWPQIEQLTERDLYYVADHDHKLLTPLMAMQATGMRVDEAERHQVELELALQLDHANKDLQDMVAPIIEKGLKYFKKPHLFRVDRKCVCCCGGKKQCKHCMNCSYGHPERSYKENVKIIAKLNGITQKAVVENAGPCVKCNATGKITKKLEFNSDSSDQVADVVYRGLHIRPRKFKGNETVKAAQLDPIKDKHPVIGALVHVSAVRADYDTVSRLRAGHDGLLHCVFDPFGTGSGRVASKESLVEIGTNAQNLPKLARRFIVPREGYTFLHPDKAQIEARVVAVLSRDKNLIEAFTVPIDWPGHPKHGVIDSHTRVVQLMSKSVEISRDQAKRLTYAVIYGARAAQLTVELNAEAFRKGQTLRVTVDQVQYMLDTFFRVFSGVTSWQQSIVDQVQRTRTLRSPLTGREFIWLGYILDTKTKELKYEIAKQVWSRLPQDAAAWVLAEGLIEMYYESGEWNKLLTPVQHGHDALLIETPLDRVEEGKAVATKILTQELWGMMFPAEMKTGANWFTASGG